MADLSQVPDVALDTDALRSVAMRETGLEDWGSDTGFIEALGVLVDSLNREADLHQIGRFVYWCTLLRLLCNRLYVERDRQADPAFTTLRIVRPVFIVGLPRTGTTMLHRVLAGHPDGRAPRLWEGMHPSRRTDTDRSTDDARIAETREIIGRIEALSPELIAAHHLDPTGPEECLWLLEHTFVDMIHELRVQVPTYSRWLKAHENDPETYRYHALLLRLLTSQQPALQDRRWILKAPRHLFALDALLKVYPDASVVQIHRAPREVLPSMCSLARLAGIAYTDRSDLAGIGAFWLERLAAGLRSFHDARQEAPDRQFLDVDFRALMADPEGTVRQVCRHCELDDGPAARTAMLSWLHDNPRNKHGRHRYTLDEFGLSTPEVDRTFTWYTGEYRVDA